MPKQPIPPSVHIHYNINKLARKRDVDGCPPLFTAAVNSLVWADMKQFFAENANVLYEVDSMTELSLFMLADVDKSSDLKSAYDLLVEYPSAIILRDY